LVNPAEGAAGSGDGDGDGGSDIDVRLSYHAPRRRAQIWARAAFFPYISPLDDARHT
jgi:hypothetical protein